MILKSFPIKFLIFLYLIQNSHEDTSFTPICVNGGYLWRCLASVFYTPEIQSETNFIKNQMKNPSKVAHNKITTKPPKIPVNSFKATKPPQNIFNSLNNRITSSRGLWIERVKFLMNFKIYFLAYTTTTTETSFNFINGHSDNAEIEFAPEIEINDGKK